MNEHFLLTAEREQKSKQASMSGCLLPVVDASLHFTLSIANVGHRATFAI